VYAQRVLPRTVDWEPYEAKTVAGDVRVLRGERDLYAYVPPSHGLTGRHFPVVYSTTA
jgi:hypothetical protein